MLSTLRDSIVRKLMLHEWYDMVFSDLSSLFRSNFSDFVKSKVSLKSVAEITKTKELMIQMDRELLNGSLTYYPKLNIKKDFYLILNTKKIFFQYNYLIANIDMILERDLSKIYLGD